MILSPFYYHFLIKLYLSVNNFLASRKGSSRFYLSKVVPLILVKIRSLASSTFIAVTTVLFLALTTIVAVSRTTSEFVTPFCFASLTFSLIVCHCVLSIVIFRSFNRSDACLLIFNSCSSNKVLKSLFIGLFCLILFRFNIC